MSKIISEPFQYDEFTECREDTHNDEELGFESGCRSFWFGECGRKRCPDPIRIVPEGSDHYLYISEDDHYLLFLAISAVQGEFYDIYEDYEFSYEEWNAILDEADHLMNYATFDELFDYLLEIRDNTEGRCDLIHFMNNCGAKFWKEKSLHEIEAKALREWTVLVRKNGEKMKVIGL